MTYVGLDVSGLDPSFKSHAVRGIGRYVSELHRYFEVTSNTDVSVGTFDHAELAKKGLCSSAVTLLPFGRTTIRQQLLYPLKLRTGAMRQFSFVHFPAHMDAPAWSTMPYVLTVLDLIPLVLADLYRAHRPSWRFNFARWLELKAIQNATLCVAISECTARDLTRILGVPAERIRVTPLGVDRSFFSLYDVRRDPSQVRTIRERLQLPEQRPLVLYVGGHDERKNIRGLVEIMSKVLQGWQGPQGSEPLLVLAGRINSKREEAQLATALWDFSMASDTVALGYVPDDALKALYGESSVFLFPSLYEGFGLPCLEAMAAGLPVVSSNTSSLPEVVGDSGVLFDPLCVEEGARRVTEILTNASTAEHFSTAGFERARLFSWERTGELTHQAYRDTASILSGSLVLPPSNGSGDRIVCDINHSHEST